MGTRFFLTSLFPLALTTGITLPAEAQLPIASVIQAGVKAVIRAADLKVQALQQKNLALQNAAQMMENKLTNERLQEIAGWTAHELDLWRSYYQELWQVKSVIRNSREVQQAGRLDAAIAIASSEAWARFRKDPRFRPGELQTIQSVYKAIVQQASENTRMLEDVVTPYRLQMDDAARRRMIVGAVGALENCYRELRRFTEENVLVSLQRARLAGQASVARRLYDIP